MPGEFPQTKYRSQPNTPVATWTASFSRACQCFGHQGLSGARRPREQNAPRDLGADLGEKGGGDETQNRRVLADLKNEDSLEQLNMYLMYFEVAFGFYRCLCSMMGFQTHTIYRYILSTLSNRIMLVFV